MARCWSHQRWWWLLLVLFAGLSRLAHGQKPSAAASTTTTAVAQAASPGIVVFLREQCDGELNSTELLRQLQHDYAGDIGMVPRAGKFILMRAYLVVYLLCQCRRDIDLLSAFSLLHEKKKNKEEIYSEPISSLLNLWNYASIIKCHFAYCVYLIIKV